MARGVNKAIIMGNLGKDPDVRDLPGGAKVTNFTVATSESWKDKQTGEKVERTEWHRVAIFGRLAEIAAEYLHKGSQVYLEGRIQTRKYQGKDGEDRYATEIIANEMQMVGGRQEQGPPQAPATRGPSRPAAPQEPQKEYKFDESFDDDIPF